MRTANSSSCYHSSKGFFFSVVRSRTWEVPWEIPEVRWDVPWKHYEYKTRELLREIPWGSTIRSRTDPLWPDQTCFHDTEILFPFVFIPRRKMHQGSPSLIFMQLISAYSFPHQRPFYHNVELPSLIFMWLIIILHDGLCPSKLASTTTKTSFPWYLCSWITVYNKLLARQSQPSSLP